MNSPDIVSEPRTRHMGSLLCAFVGVLGITDAKAAKDVPSQVIFEPSLVNTTGGYTTIATLDPPATRQAYSVAFDTDPISHIKTAVVGFLDDNNGGRGAAYVFTLAPGASSWSQQGHLEADDGATLDDFGAAVAVEGNSIVVGAPNHRVDSDLGAIYAFERDDRGVWRKRGDTIRTGAGGAFGTSLAIHKGTLAVGAPGFGDNGIVWIFTHSGSPWALINTATMNYPTHFNSQFGTSVAFADDALLVGSPGLNGSSGGVWYKCAPYTGVVARAMFGDTTGAHFGESVAAWGSCASKISFAVGAPNRNASPSGNQEGRVEIYEDFVLKNSIDGELGFEHFGKTLAYADNTLAIATSPPDGHASIFTFNRVLNNWILQDGMQSSGTGVALDGTTLLTPTRDQKSIEDFSYTGFQYDHRSLLISQPNNVLGFGTAVAMDGDHAMVSAPGIYSTKWPVYDRINNSDGWSPQFSVSGPANVTPIGLASCQSVAISQEAKRVITGNPLGGSRFLDGAVNLYRTTSPGSAATEISTPSTDYSYFGCGVAASGKSVIVGAPLSKDRRGLVSIVDLATLDQTEIAASDATVNDYFGVSVAIDGDQAVVGAPYKAGVGAAYVYKRSGATWIETAKLVSPAASGSDLFGSSVAISGGNILIGAPGATRDGRVGAGIAYFFNLSGGGWGIRQGIGDGPSPNGHYADHVALSGYTAVITASEKDTSYILNNRGNRWAVSASLNGEASTGFGSSVMIGRNADVLIGAPRDFYDGRAYVFGTDVIFDNGFGD